MKRLIAVAVVFILFSSFAHRVDSQVIKLTFRGLVNSLYVPFDSVKIKNLTQGGDTVLYWPDSVLLIVTTSQPEDLLPQPVFSIAINGSNPVSDQVGIKIHLPQTDRLEIRATDLMGHQNILFNEVVAAGGHTFNFVPGKQPFIILTAFWRTEVASLKVISAAVKVDELCGLSYSGGTDYKPVKPPKKSISSFIAANGDLLLLEGFLGALYYSAIDTVVSNKTYLLNFTGSSSLCPGTPIVNYGGDFYPTVLIGTQCWLAKNLDVGIYVESTPTGTFHSDVSNNGVIEKYCYFNFPPLCDLFGGLYDWDEMMGYSTTAGIQGICPVGWHIPTHAEFNILENSLGGASVAGGKLKASGILYWQEPNSGGTNSSGFSALPGGDRQGGNFLMMGQSGYYWTSTLYSPTNPYTRGIYHNNTNCAYGTNPRSYAFSVRCLKN
jgi:uncharacterized protein (TIGR02145 family)